MINKYITKAAIFLIAIVMWQCEPKVDSFTPSNGDADFSKFVAVGDSYTAGYTDGAIGVRGQESSFAYILAKQLESVGSNGFNQPLVQSNGSVGSTVIGENQNSGYFVLSTETGSLAPKPTMGDMAIFAERVFDADKPFNNMGIPGAKAIHLGPLPAPYPPYPQLNPYYARFASSMDATVIGDAMLAQPSFFSLWIGNNDVLAYALEGGEADEITEPAIFEGAMTGYLQVLTSTGAKGVVGNIPDIDAIPYFNHILSEGHLPLVIVDEDMPGGIRPLIQGEKILLSASTALGMGYGQSVEKPLPAKYVLDAAELAAIRNATTAYNASIEKLCANFELAKVDLNAMMKELSESGMMIDGNKYSAAFVIGGVFSLDGIHATGRGSAVIANGFIEAINKHYGAQVPMANINDYGSVEFP